ncbi:uncharacterized protein LOC126214950 [Schistocerca nitens]|uniref:uncharacterized protein LOC126214950 n=1 Tax=Schistocerca nitens TaxID=7011 RepID=UPI0021188F17|nr:uncharacterized protein LOC126214950 [Schistocerca nitens]
MDDGVGAVLRRKTFCELVRVSAAVAGIEFSYAAETAFVSPTLLQIGVAHRLMTLAWALSPLVGFFVTPLLGSLSDRCRLPWGRRRPFIALLAAGVLLGLILVPNGADIGYALGDPRPAPSPSPPGALNATPPLEMVTPSEWQATNASLGPGLSTTESPAALANESSVVSRKPQSSHPWGVVFTILGTVLLDFDADACQSPARAYLLDVTVPEDHARGLSTFTIMAGLGGFMGYALGGINWDATFIGRVLGGHVRAVFTLITFIFVACVTYTVTSFREIPLDVLEADEARQQLHSQQNQQAKPDSAEYTKISTEASVNGYGYGSVSPDYANQVDGPPDRAEYRPIAGTDSPLHGNGYVNFGYDESYHKPPPPQPLPLHTWKMPPKRLRSPSDNALRRRVPQNSHALEILRRTREFYEQEKNYEVGQHLVMEYDALAGAVPAEVGQHLVMEHDALAGAVPAEVGQHLVMEYDALAGAVPAEVGQHLVMEHDALAGAVPAEVGQHLVMEYDALAGAVPAEVGQHLVMEYDALAGAVPAEVGQHLVMEYDALAGAVPAEVGQHLVMEHDALAGAVPAEVGQHLVMEYDALAGAVPAEVGQHLVMEHDALAGAVPAEVGQHLVMEYDALAGAVPAEVGQHLVMEYDALAGAVPAEVGQHLVMEYDALAGAVPAEVSPPLVTAHATPSLGQYLLSTEVSPPLVTAHATPSLGQYLLSTEVSPPLVTAHATPSLGQYLLSIVWMPGSLRVLCLTNLFCWMAHVCYSLYFTDFVGEAVFGGDPQAEDGTKARQLYEEGVRFGCWGMSMYSLSCACYSFIIERLINRFRARKVYVGGLLFYSAGMALMALTKGRVGVILFSWTAGVMYSTLFTMPYLLVAHYHASGTFSVSATGEALPGSHVRGLGTDVAIVSSMVFLAQFALSMCMGAIVSAAGTTTAVAAVASFLALCGAVCASQVMYLDL